jgi:type I restriction enzyme S subunit
MTQPTSEWKEYKIEDLGRVVTGHTPSRRITDFFESEGHIWIKPTDIRKGVRYVPNPEEYYSQKAFEKYQKSLIPPLSTCVVTIGTVGEKICLTHKYCFTNQAINAVIPDCEKFDPMFVYYLLKNNLDSVLQLNIGTASGRENISKSNFSSIIIKAPSKKTQLKISSIIARYDDLLENNTQRIKILEEMAQAIYREWFVNFRFPGHEGVRMGESELGPVPEGWVIGTFTDLVVNQKNTTNAGEHLRDLNYVPIDCLPKKSLVLTEVMSWEAAQSSLHFFMPNDILFGAMRPYFHKVLLAPSSGITRKTCFILRPISDEKISYSLLTLFRDETIDYATTHSKGATIPYVAWDGSMSDMKIIIPPKNVLMDFEKIMRPILDSLKSFFNRQKNLRRTRDLLLPKLISGEIDVSGLDIEIASAL